MKGYSWKWENIEHSYWETPCDRVVDFYKSKNTKKANKVLDVGCGLGRHSIFLAQEGWMVTAIDLSQTALNYLNKASKQKNLNIDISIADMHNLPFGNGEFDSVLAYHSIYHTNLNGLINNIKEIHRVLKKGGTAYVTLNSKQSSDWIDRLTESTIDNYTIYKFDGHEKDIPHTYVNHTDFPLLFDKFSIDEFHHVEEEYNLKISAHYHVHITK